jgi:electron transfer flavoprotein beta subunit
MNIENNIATLEREIEGGKEVLTAPLPLVVSATEGMAEPRIPNMRGIMSARSKPLTVVEAIAVSQLVEFVEYEKPAPRSQVKLVSSDDVKELINLLHTEAKTI